MSSSELVLLNLSISFVFDKIILYREKKYNTTATMMTQATNPNMYKDVNIASYLVVIRLR